MRNVNRNFNKKGPIKHIVEVNIFYKRHRERTEIDIVKEKQSVVLEILQLAYHNTEINQKIEKIKITRCSEKYEKQ